MAQPVTPLIIALARKYGLDPQAVIAVARGEGGLVDRPGSEDIGDEAGGGSFGPFQLYTRGALPKAVRARGIEAADDWAWSQPGIAYALSQMAQYARGLRGPAAVEAIIRKFERPANPDKSVAAALARLGSSGASGTPVSSIATQYRDAGSIPAASTRRGMSPIVQAILNDTDLLDALRARENAPEGLPAVPREIPPPGFPGSSEALRGLTELIYDPMGSIFDGVVSNKPYGGHGSHVHAAFTNPQSVLRAIQIAQGLGLAVRENPYTDPVDPVHTQGSHHYRTFPGRYNGRQLGQAVDVSGNPQKLRAFYQQLARLRG